MTHDGGTPATREAAEPVEHGRRLVQRGLFAGPNPVAPDDLYCTVELGVAVRGRNRVSIDGHALVSTNTYFGRFPASYWQRWSGVGEVAVELVCTGTGAIRLVASDADGRPRTVLGRDVEAADGLTVRLPARIDRFADGGALWLELETGREGLEVADVRWTVMSARPERTTSIVICTYNRADDCLATLGALAGDPEALAAVAQVYVVDQGSDPVESRAGFAATEEALGGRLRYIRQPNLGGAGGFTRGIYEVTAPGAGQSDVLLMDDDIMLEPDSVIRMKALAGLAARPTIVGGQMLNLLHPNRLHVSAEETDLRILRAGLPVEGALTNADVTRKRQDLRVDAQYNAWWSCLIPHEVIRAVGYPLPLFFQWDDIEYGLRARAAGFPTVTLPGAGVWHADFAWKNWDDWSRYFSFRNSLIVSALHSDFDRTRIVRHLARELSHYLTSMRYGLAATMIRAVEDFLRGPDVLADGGGETAAEVRKLRAEYPETSNHPAHAVPGVDADAMRLTPMLGTPGRPRAVLAKRLARQLLRRPAGSAAIAAQDAQWWHVSLFQTAVVTDPSQEGVRVHRLDRDLMVELGRRGGQVLWRLHREGERARDEYRRRMPELTSRENWTRLYTSK
jgi:galactofuranosylgalactofuranosylrhamnosyl-N-acetylglucosaminyl-diphospho-decaprenol beta-1,5/1,6-galactofuranosyltransferase